MALVFGLQHKPYYSSAGTYHIDNRILEGENDWFWNAYDSYHTSIEEVP